MNPSSSRTQKVQNPVPKSSCVTAEAHDPGPDLEYSAYHSCYLLRAGDGHCGYRAVARWVRGGQGGFAGVSVEATTSSKDKTTYLLMTHLTRLDKLPKARTMHEVIRSIWAKRDAPQGTRCRHSVQGSPQVEHRARSPFMQSWLRSSHTSLRMIRLRPYASTDQCVHRRPCSEVLCDGLNAFDIFASCPYTALNDLRRIGRTYPHAPR